MHDAGSDRFLIAMPMVAHARCLAKFDEKSPVYALLSSGIVLRDDPRNPMVQIRCDADQAQVIRNLLATECPEILHETRICPDPA